MRRFQNFKNVQTFSCFMHYVTLNFEAIIGYYTAGIQPLSVHGYRPTQNGVLIKKNAFRRHRYQFF